MFNLTFDRRFHRYRIRRMHSGQKGVLSQVISRANRTFFKALNTVQPRFLFRALNIVERGSGRHYYWFRNSQGGAITRKGGEHYQLGGYLDWLHLKYVIRCRHT